MTSHGQEHMLSALAPYDLTPMRTCLLSLELGFFRPRFTLQ